MAKLGKAAPHVGLCSDFINQSHFTVAKQGLYMSLTLQLLEQYDYLNVLKLQRIYSAHFWFKTL